MGDIEPSEKVLSISNKGSDGCHQRNADEYDFRILVVDNDSQNLSQMKELLSPSFLRRDDVYATFCSSSSEALRLVEEN